MGWWYNMQNEYFERLGEVLYVSTKTNRKMERNWKDAEKKIGIKLPSDYKNFIDKYGTGGLDNFLWVLTPFDEGYINLIKRSEIILCAYEESKTQSDDGFVHDVYPNKDGIFPWGYTDNGDELYWKTNEDSGKWDIVVYPSRESFGYVYKMSLTEFLYKLIVKELICSAFPNDFLLDPKNKYIFE